MSADPIETLTALERELETDLDLASRIAVLHRIAAIAGEQLGDDAREADQYRRILDLDSADTTAIDGLAAICERQGDFTMLVDLLRQRADLTEDHDARQRALLRAALVCVEALSDLDRARELCTLVLDADPTNIEAQQLLDRTRA